MLTSATCKSRALWMWDGLLDPGHYPLLIPFWHDLRDSRLGMPVNTGLKLP